jgi:hypothetical protein
MIGFKRNDGGRSAAGYKGLIGDCVVRAIAIASGQPYQKIYDDLCRLSLKQKNKLYQQVNKKTGFPTYGISKKVYHAYLLDLGFQWVPVMSIGTGCTMHLHQDEIPDGILVCQLSRHLSAVIDKVVHDLYDQSRSGTRYVYGYYHKPKAKVNPIDKLTKGFRRISL